MRSMTGWAMSDTTTLFLADRVNPTAERSLSPRAKAFVIIGLALAAWVPVLLPLFLIFRR
jgi:hypothetical protein